MESKRSYFLAGTVFGATLSLGLALVYSYFQQIIRQPSLKTRAKLPVLDELDKQQAAALTIAVEDLRSGIIERRLVDNMAKRVLHAGYRNFRESWARDFGFSSYGLLALQDYRPVKETLEAFFLHQVADGRLPIKLHSLNVLSRYLHSFFNREQPIEKSLKPKYITGHGTASLDGQALLVIAASNYVRESGDVEFASKWWDKLKRAINWLDGFQSTSDGLLNQRAYADWADTIARRGKVLYTNVVYWKALSEMATMANILEQEADELVFVGKSKNLKREVQEQLWRSELGYFTTSDRLDNFSSAGNLLTIAWDLADEQQANSILDFMQTLEIADPVPTQVAFPPYNLKDIAIENRLVGLTIYHTKAAWLWIGAWHVVALKHIGRLEEAKTIISRIARTIVKYGQVHEVYNPGGEPLSSMWYKSESPLTWSAGMVVYAYHDIRNKF